MSKHVRLQGGGHDGLVVRVADQITTVNVSFQPGTGATEELTYRPRNTQDYDLHRFFWVAAHFHSDRLT